jgi:hypothetical protein
MSNRTDFNKLADEVLENITKNGYARAKFQLALRTCYEAGKYEAIARIDDEKTIARIVSEFKNAFVAGQEDYRRD